MRDPPCSGPPEGARRRFAACPFALQNAGNLPIFFEITIATICIIPRRTRHVNIFLPNIQFIKHALLFSHYNALILSHTRYVNHILCFVKITICIFCFIYYLFLTSDLSKQIHTNAIKIQNHHPAEIIKDHTSLFIVLNSAAALYKKYRRSEANMPSAITPKISFCRRICCLHSLNLPHDSILYLNYKDFNIYIRNF